MEMDNKLNIIRKKVEDQLVAGIRFMGQSQDIPEFFTRLESAVGGHAAGKPIFLFYWGHLGTDIDVELCLPVHHPINAGKVKSRVLMGGQMLTLQQRGPYERIPESWRSLGRYMKERNIGWGNGPGREVYLEGPEQHGDRAEEYLTEIQAPLLLPQWIGSLADGIASLAGEETARQIVGSGRDLAPEAEPRERAFWVQGMLGRLEDALPDPVHQHTILAGCSHIFPERRVAQMRNLYQKTGDLDAVIALMNEDRSENGACYYETPLREGGIVRLTKIPFDAAGYLAAQTSLERKLAYCHCPMVKDALREGIKLTSSYCHCGAGWYHTLWEGILERPVQVDVVRSLLNGDEACEFAIHLG